MQSIISQKSFEAYHKALGYYNLLDVFFREKCDDA